MKHAFCTDLSHLNLALLVKNAGLIKRNPAYALEKVGTCMLETFKQPTGYLQEAAAVIRD